MDVTQDYYKYQKYKYKYKKYNREYISNIGKTSGIHTYNRLNSLSFQLALSIGEYDKFFSLPSLAMPLIILSKLPGNYEWKNDINKLLSHKYTFEDIKTLYTIFNNKITKSANVILAKNNKYITRDFSDKIKPFAQVEIGSKHFDAKQINQYISQKTGGMIKDLISQGDIENAVMILINTIYFKAQWMKPFDPSDTNNMSFYGLTKTTETPMMFQSSEFSYYSDDKWKAIELEYSSMYSMYIFLPKEKKNVGKLSFDNAENIIRQMKKTKIDLYVPKFNQRHKYVMNDYLSSMGLSSLFNTSEEIYVDKIIHEAVVEVTEEGTTASAATAVVMREMAVMPIEIPVFRADKPFVYTIQRSDKKNNIILFYGLVADL